MSKRVGADSGIRWGIDASIMVSRAEPSRAEPSRAEPSRAALMRGAKRRLPLLALALLAIVAVATPTERAEAQSVPNLLWSNTSFEVSEPSTSSSLEIQTSQPLTNAVTFSYTLGGTATCGTDYTIAGADCAQGTGTFTIPMGTPRFTGVVIPITALEDTVSDNGETIILTITDGADYNLGIGVTATATIYENTGKSAFRTGGRAQVNGTLTVHRVCTDPEGESSIGYQWQRASNPRTAAGRFRNISGAASQSYTLQQADSGHFIRLSVEYTDSNGLHTVVYTPMVGPIGPVAFDNTVKFSRNSYNAREGDPLRPTLTFSSPTKRERTFGIVFQTCSAHTGEDIVTDDPSESQFTTSAQSAKHSVTVPAGVTSHTFSLPVPLDDRIEGYETFVMGFGGIPRGITIGDQGDATNQGQYAVVQIADVNLVPENWALKPAGVSAGDQFRLLFRTENERNAQSGDIGVYDTFVRNRIGSSTHGHADIRQYAPTFRVVGSTGAVAAAWHTATGITVSGEPSHTPFSHPIHWLNGARIADDYNDFWDGNWDDNAQTKGRNANGQTSSNDRGPNTGTRTGTTHATAGAKATMHLGHSANTRWGGAAANQNPINQGSIPVGNNNVYIGLSGIFLPLDVSAANPLVTIEARRTRVNEGDAIRYTLRAFPAPSSPVTVNVKVADSSVGGPRFVESGELGPRTPMIPTSGVVTFVVNTHQDQLGEADGEVTVSIGAGSGYRTLAAYDTVVTAVTDDDEASTLSASVALGNGTGGPARTGANVDFTFSLPKARERGDLDGIRTQLAWGGDVISPRSDRPSTWDRYAVNPEWRPDGSARVSRHGAYVRPWLESSIMRGQRSFSLRVHVKNRAEAGGEVGNGWIAMRVAEARNGRYRANPAAEWACMPVGGGTCPSAWPGVPTATIVALDNGRVMSGSDARYGITVNPAPAAGQTLRVYLKTWEVFIQPTDPKVLIVGGVRINADGSPSNQTERDKLTGKVDIDANGNPLDEDVVVETQTQRGVQYKYYYLQPRRGGTQVQFTAHTHHDVDSSGSATFTLPTKVFRSKENMAGRDYWAEVQEDVAYDVGSGFQAEVETTMFNPNAEACWYGHSHQRARLITVDGSQVYSPGGMGITECLTSDEIDEWKYGNGSTANRPTVWTSCKPEYSHSDNRHPYTHGGQTHHHHNHNPYIKLGDGSCPGGQSQLDGGDSQDGQTDDPPDDPFPDPGALGFSDVTSSGMTVSWPEREVDHYLVYWAENVANADARSAQVDAGTLTYAITGLKPGTEYAVIVYSQDHDEVTPTGYQRTAAGSTTDTTPPPPDYSELKARIRDYAGEQASNSDHARRWNRVLAALGDEDAIAAGHDPMTASEAQGYADRGWERWDEVVEALTEVESREATDPEPDPIPELSLSGGGGVDEGGSASFTIHADPAPAADVTVSVAVAQTGDYLDAPGAGTRTITLATGATAASLTVATVNDGTDEADGSVSVSLNAGAGYTVSSSNGSATVAVRDDDEPTPEVSISSGGEVTEGGSASFTVTASPAPASPLDVDVTVAQSGDFAAAGQTGARTVTVPSSGSATLAVATVDDGTDEADGSVSVTIGAGTGYRVSSAYGTASAAVRDDDPPPASSCVSGTQWRTVEGYYKSNAGKAPNYGANWYRVLIAYRSEHTHRALPDWTGPTAEPTAAFTVKEAEDGEKAWSGWTPVRKVLECLRDANRIGRSFAPLVPAASNPAREGVVRIANPGARPAAVRIAATDDAGWRPEPLTLHLGPGASVDLTSADLERGSPSKGLSGGIGTGTGDWRLTVSGDSGIRVQPHVRSADGRLAAMGAVAPLQDGAHQVAVLHPADGAQRTGLLRLVNRGSEALGVRITAIDDAGASPGGAVSLALPARAAATYAASELERGGAGLDGALGDGTGLWRLRVASNGDLAVMALAEEPGGHLENLSDPAAAARLESGVHAVAGFPSAYGPAGRPGTLRIVNRSAAGGTVTIRPRDAQGRALGPVRLWLDAGGAANLDAWDLELGNPAKGLSGGAGPAPGDWRIEVESDLDLRVLPLVRAPAGLPAAPRGRPR